MTKKLIEETKEIILETKYRPHIEKIILFGSVAEKEQSLTSDIDIAVVLSKKDKKNVNLI